MSANFCREIVKTIGVDLRDFAKRWNNYGCLWNKNKEINSNKQYRPEKGKVSAFYLFLSWLVLYIKHIHRDTTTSINAGNSIKHTHKLYFSSAEIHGRSLNQQPVICVDTKPTPLEYVILFFLNCSSYSGDQQKIIILTNTIPPAKKKWGYC